MKYSKRQSLIQQLLSNYRICYVDGEKYIVKNPSLDILYRAHVLYEDILYNTRFQQWIKEDDCEKILMQKSLWSIGDNTKLTNLNKTLEDLKISIYRNSFRQDQVKKIRRSIQDVQKQIYELHERKMVLNTYTQEEFAQFIKIGFILLKTLYRSSNVSPIKNELLFENDETADYFLLHKIIVQIHKQLLSISIYRELARTEPWLSYWHIGKPNPFSCSISELNDEQKTIIMYSRLYDNIEQNEDRPSENIIDDDDMLDGWIILQKRENKKARASKQIEKQTGKINSNAKEVFLPAHNILEAREINNLNDYDTKIVKKQRENIINTKGKVRDIDFLDRKLEIRRQNMERIKGVK